MSPLLCNLIIGVSFIIGFRWYLLHVTPQNKFDSKCQHEFFLLNRAINYCPSSAGLEDYENKITEFYFKYKGKASDEVVKDLSGKLHAVIFNRYAALNKHYVSLAH